MKISGRSVLLIEVERKVFEPPMEGVRAMKPSS